MAQTGKFRRLGAAIITSKGRPEAEAIPILVSVAGRLFFLASIFFWRRVLFGVGAMVVSGLSQLIGVASARQAVLPVAATILSDSGAIYLLFANGDRYEQS